MKKLKVNLSALEMSELVYITYTSVTGKNTYQLVKSKYGPMPDWRLDQDELDFYLNNWYGDRDYEEI